MMKIIIKADSKGMNVGDGNELETTIQSDPGVRSVYANKWYFFPLVVLVGILRRICYTLGYSKRLEVPRWMNVGTHNNFFSVLMAGVGFRKTPQFILPCKKSVYLFDCWPAHWNAIRNYLREFNITHVFINSDKFVSEIKRMNLPCGVTMVPEGINVKEYWFLPYKDKDIDLMEFGRKHPTYHKRLKAYLKGKEERHQYTFVESRETFKALLSRSKISICFPRSVTHPEDGEDFEFMTMRYLQTIASKCLIIGKSPPDMITLFGYNPVIDADLENPEQQLENILANYEDYHSLIEKNYQEVCANHTWQNRWSQIAQILKESNNHLQPYPR